MSQRGVDQEKGVIKPGVHVTLKVQDTGGHCVYHTMRRTEKLQGLMDFYYASVPAVEYGTGTFLFDCIVLRGCATPAELEMEDGDEVDVFGARMVALMDFRFVTLKVVDQEERLIRHTMRMTDKLQAVMDAYYDKAPDVAYGTGSFLFENVRLHRDRTPVDFKLEDGDAIAFFKPLLGGALLAYSP